MPHPVLQSSTQGFYIFADNVDAYGEGLAGLSITVSLSKSGGAFNAVSPTITDRGSGVYWIAPLAAHRDTLGEIAWQFAAGGAVIAPRFERVVSVNDQAAFWGVPAAVLTAATDSGGIASNIIAKDGEPFVPLPYQPASQETLLEVQGAVENLDGPGSPTGPGGIPVTIPVSINNEPVDGASVWITTDPEGTNQIAGVIYTDTFGNTKPAFTLEPGIFYVWVQKAGINFTSPHALQVLENGTYQWYTG